VLKSELEVTKKSATEARKSRNHAVASLDALANKLTSERIVYEGSILEAKRAASKELNIAIAIKEHIIVNRDAKLVQAQDEIMKLTAELEDRNELGAERLATIRSICGRLGGTPRAHRTDRELEEMRTDLACAARVNMSAAIGSVIGKVGEDSEISLIALMNADKENGYLEAVFESEEMWDLRMDWAEETRDDLSLAWSAKLTSDIRDKLVVSYDKLDELRFALSHHRVGKTLRPRVWFTNP
jgi:hypothetical protein